MPAGSMGQSNTQGRREFEASPKAYQGLGKGSPSSLGVQKAGSFGKQMKTHITPFQDKEGAMYRTNGSGGVAQGRSYKPAGGQPYAQPSNNNQFTNVFNPAQRTASKFSGVVEVNDNHFIAKNLTKGSAESIGGASSHQLKSTTLPKR